MKKFMRNSELLSQVVPQNQPDNPFITVELGIPTDGPGSGDGSLPEDPKDPFVGGTTG